MTQKLRIKVKRPGGGANFKYVDIRRSWIDASGKSLYLHANGVYGSKTGAPVSSAADLAIIDDKYQKKMAMHWWNTVGKVISAKFYKAEEERLEALAMSGMEEQVPDNSNLDQVMYIRRPVNDRRRAAFSDPFTWTAYFKSRPDWWGFANVIELGDWRYQISVPEEEPVPDEGHDTPEPPVVGATESDPAGASVSDDMTDGGDAVLPDVTGGADDKEEF